MNEGGIPFSQEHKTHECMCYHCLEGKGREILLIVFISFCWFLKGLPCRNSPLSTGRNDRSKPGKLLNIIGLIGNNTNNTNRVLKAHCRGVDWINKTIKKKRIRQGSVISLYSEIHEDDNNQISFIFKTKYDPGA